MLSEPFTLPPLLLHLLMMIIMIMINLSLETLEKICFCHYIWQQEGFKLSTYGDIRISRNYKGRIILETKEHYQDLTPAAFNELIATLQDRKNRIHKNLRAKDSRYAKSEKPQQRKRG